MDQQGREQGVSRAVCSGSAVQCTGGKQRMRGQQGSLQESVGQEINREDEDRRQGSTRQRTWYEVHCTEISRMEEMGQYSREEGSQGQGKGITGAQEKSEGQCTGGPQDGGRRVDDGRVQGVQFPRPPLSTNPHNSLSKSPHSSS